MATILKTVLEMEVEEADRIEHIGDCHIKSFNGLLFLLIQEGIGFRR